MKIRFEETGETRAPFSGEWFRDDRGFPVQARFNFSCIQLPILKIIIEEEDEKNEI